MPLMKNSIELLPYPTEVGTYYLINVLDEDEYLNRELTVCGRRMPNGICRDITKYHFHQDMLINKHVFRVPDRPLTRFISGEFVDICKKHELQGIYLDDSVKVWDSTDS